MSKRNLSRRDLALLGTFALAPPGAAGAAPKSLSMSRGVPISDDVIAAAVRDAHLRYKTLNEGKNLDHPVLSKVPTEYFGIVVGTPDGRFSMAGDTTPTFTLQSVGKVFTLALVLQESGSDAVEDLIGVNATGRVFNSIEAIEAHQGRDQNPLVTPGAIATTAMVKGDTAEEKWAKIIAIQGAFAGRQLGISQDVYAASSATNQRNRAIGALMSAYGRIKGDHVAATDLYTRQCSIEVTAKDIGVMAATLAAGGRNPITGRQVVDTQLIPRILAVMSTAGLYDTSGQWLFHTGLPAKSGVGGGLIAVSPGKFGIAGFSPPLDAAGNSVRSQRAIMEISARLGGNPYAAGPDGRHPVDHDLDDRTGVPLNRTKSPPRPGTNSRPE